MGSGRAWTTAALLLAPMFASERLSCQGDGLAVGLSSPGTQPGGPKRDTALRDPLELIDRRAVLIPPPRVHRHRYHGVLGPVARLRVVVTPPGEPSRRRLVWVHTHVMAMPPEPDLPAEASAQAGKNLPL